MALIKCIECGNEVSDKAEKCPKCAYPISHVHQEKKPQVIEQTSKDLKKKLLISIGLIIAGFALMFAIPAIGAILALVGIFSVIRTKYSIWWHHK